MRQLQLFTSAALAQMRDRTASRRYSPARDEFRREHERRRARGLIQRHGERLRRLRDRSCASPAASAHESRRPAQTRDLPAVPVPAATTIEQEQCVARGSDASTRRESSRCGYAAAPARSGPIHYRDISSRGGLKSTSRSSISGLGHLSIAHFHARGRAVFPDALIPATCFITSGPRPGMATVQTLGLLLSFRLPTWALRLSFGLHGRERRLRVIISGAGQAWCAPAQAISARAGSVRFRSRSGRPRPGGWRAGSSPPTRARPSPTVLATCSRSPTAPSWSTRRRPSRACEHCWTAPAWSSNPSASRPSWKTRTAPPAATWSPQLRQQRSRPSSKTSTAPPAATCPPQLRQQRRPGRLPRWVSTLAR
jgi:hypothetical protein